MIEARFEISLLLLILLFYVPASIPGVDRSTAAEQTRACPSHPSTLISPSLLGGIWRIIIRIIIINK